MGFGWDFDGFWFVSRRGIVERESPAVGFGVSGFDLGRYSKKRQSSSGFWVRVCLKARK